MTRLAVRASAGGLMVLLALLWALDGPAHSGAIANLGEPGAGAAVGLLWIALTPVVVLVVPALLLTAAAEGLHAIWARAGTGAPVGGLGSRSGPGDTDGGE